MNSPAVIRPPRVTTACLFLGMSCLIVLGFLASWISGWGSLTVQKEVRKTFNVTAIPDWLQQALLAGAAVSAVGVVFAIYAFQGHRASRVILTVYAALLGMVFLTQGTFGVFPAVFAIACGIYLWTAEARQWYGIMNGTIAAPEPAPRPDPFSVPVPPPVIDAPTPPTPVRIAEAPVQAPVQAPVRAPVAVSGVRPQNVLFAGLIAIIMSALVAFICSINVLFYILAKGEYLRAFRESTMLQDKVKETGMTVDGVASTLFVVCSIMAVAAALAIVAGAFVLAGKPLARTFLVVLSVPTAAISLIAVPFGLLWAAGAIATIVLLRRPESRAWFQSHGTSRTP